MAKMRDSAPENAATRERRLSSATPKPQSAPVFHADDKSKRKRSKRRRRLTKASTRSFLKKDGARSRSRKAPQRARKTTRRRTVAKQTRAQRRASLANLKKAHRMRRRRSRHHASEAPAKRLKPRRTTIRRNLKGKFRKKIQGYTHEAARRAAASRRRSKRRHGGKRRHYVKGHYSYEARRRSSRRRRRHAHEFAAYARSRGRRHSRKRRYAGALENPLGGIELAITILTGSVGFMAAEIADRMMAIRKGAPVVTLAVNGGKAPQLPMYLDLPRLAVATGITAAPLVASTFIKSPTWRSALQTMGIGAGLRSMGNILVGLAAKFTDKPDSATDKKNIFAFEQSLERAHAEWNKQTAEEKTEAEKKYETGTKGLPQGFQGFQRFQGAGACPTCNRTDGLGACCNRAFARPPQPQLPPPPPPPKSDEGKPLAASQPQSPPPPPATKSDEGKPPAVSLAPQPPKTSTTVPGSIFTVPGSPPPAESLAPLSKPFTQSVAGLRGMPQRFMVGTGSVAPRPNWNWGHQGSEDAAE